ncbi:subtype A tannase [Acidipropionibacterium timonense]|uniref:subtype A tannase n=1 Tax=Acidipropionibacterium timonense TaxID=2161818 RepID=UPI00143698C5|nr:subtype A tannase [Acidipropionibacterium timonense]
MTISRRVMLQGSGLLGIVGAMALAGCDDSSTASATASASASASTAATASTASSSLALDSSAWKYDSTNDVYYQLGLSYVAKPQSTDYEQLAIYVPGAYLSGTRNTDGSYTVKENTSGKVGGFTSSTAPIVMPVNTPGYAAQRPATSYSYSDVSSFLKAGFVYVLAGLRGKDSQSSSYTGNAPWGVVDLKSAVRYLRFNDAAIPGDTASVFVFGHSGGGAQSAIMGASGDSALFTPYLTALGAATTDAKGRKLSDAVAGAMCWCPITTLDWANAAYEWNMGQFASTGTRAAGTWTKPYSTNLAEAFASYQNRLGLKDSSGTKLVLEKSSSGTYLSGTYYDHLVQVVEDSLNEFLARTTFPYTPNTSQQTGMGGVGGTSGGAPQSGQGAPSGAASGSAPSGAPTAGSGSGTPPAGMSGAPGGSTSTSSTTYQTLDAYIAHLNESSTWVTYDATTKKATVKNLAGFVASQKAASKDVGAFDGVSRGQTENLVMGLGTTSLHFSAPSAAVIRANQASYAKLTAWKASYGANQYSSDLAKTDSVGKTVTERMAMYNPMYFLSRTYTGYWL